MVQEGGYRTASIGANANRFFTGLAQGIREWADSRREFSNHLHGITFRTDVLPRDPGRIRKLVTLTGFFSEEEVKVAGELAEEHLKTGPGTAKWYFSSASKKRPNGDEVYTV